MSRACAARLIMFHRILEMERIILGALIFALIMSACFNAAPATSASRKAETDGMEQVFVPAGDFEMGGAVADPDAEEDEKPRHTVFVDSLWMDKTEVTNQMYIHCISSTACSPPATTKYYLQAKYQNHPVQGISWDQANAYCAWAERRLPTEAEWEKAARGADGRIYPWGDELPSSDYLNFEDRVGETTPVGAFPQGASPYGAMDMAGNVWEWVADGYTVDFYASSPQENPLSTFPVNRRVLRGGNWESNARNVRTTNRFWAFPGRNDTDGFRCADSD